MDLDFSNAQQIVGGSISTDCMYILYMHTYAQVVMLTIIIPHSVRHNVHVVCLLRRHHDTYRIIFILLAHIFW